MKTEKTYLYCRLADRIREYILSEKLDIGSRLPAERELARRFDVAFLTVRRALSLLEQDGIIRKIPRRGSIIEMLPRSRVARKRIGITIWLDAGADHPSTLTRLSVAGRVFGNDFEIIIVYITREMVEYGDWSPLLNSTLLDGLLVTVQEIPSLVLDRLGELPFPVVFEGFRNRYPGGAADLAGGMALLMNYLVGQGHQRICMITRSMEHCPWVAEQVTAFYDCARALELPDCDAISSGDYSRECGFNYTMARLNCAEQKPTAIVYGDDVMAQGGLDALARLNLNCPGDVSVVSRGAVGSLAMLTNPALTGLRYSNESSSEYCCQLLRLLVEGTAAEGMNSCRLIRQELVVRESSASVPCE